MGRQSARIFYNGKDHKEIFYNGKYHDALWLNGKCLWEKIGLKIIDTGLAVNGALGVYAGYVPLKKFYVLRGQYLTVYNDDFTGILNHVHVGDMGAMYYSGSAYYSTHQGTYIYESEDGINWYKAVLRPDLAHSKLPGTYMINDRMIKINNVRNVMESYRLYRPDADDHYIEFEKEISFPDTVSFYNAYPVVIGTKVYMDGKIIDFTDDDIEADDIKTVGDAYKPSIYNTFCTEEYIYLGSQADSNKNPLTIQRLDKYGIIEKTWKFTLPEDEDGYIGASCHFVYRDKYLIVFSRPAKLDEEIIIYGLESNYKKTIPIGSMGYGSFAYVGCVSTILETEKGIRIILKKNNSIHLLDVDLEEE